MVELLLGVLIISAALILLSPSVNFIAKFIWAPILITIFIMVDMYSKISKVYIRMKGEDFLGRMNRYPFQEIFGYSFNLKKFYENNFRSKKATPEESEAFVEMLYNEFNAEQLSTLKYTVEKELQIHSSYSSSQIGISAISIALFALFISAISSGSSFIPYLVFVVVITIIAILAGIKRKDKIEMDVFRQMLVCIELAQYQQRTE